MEEYQINISPKTSQTEHSTPLGLHFLAQPKSLCRAHVSSSRLSTCPLTHSRGRPPTSVLHSRRFFFPLPPSHQLPSHQPPGFQKFSQGATMVAEGNAPSLSEVEKDVSSHSPACSLVRYGLSLWLRLTHSFSRRTGAADGGSRSYELLVYRVCVLACRMGWS